MQSLLFTILILFTIIAIKYYMAMKEFNSQDFATKENKYKKAIETGKNNSHTALAYINLTTLYINNKNYTEARKYIDLAKENIKSNNKTIHLVLKSNEATLLIYEDKLSEAELLIDELLPQCKGLFNQQLKKVLLNNLEEIKKRSAL